MTVVVPVLSPTAMLTVHGIPNCNTIRRARAWLDAHGIAYAFHDYRKVGVPAALDDWVAALGWEVLLNRQGQTFRKLPQDDRADLDAARAVALMRAYPAAIRRPVLTGDGVLLAGFKPDLWGKTLT